MYRPKNLTFQQGGQYFNPNGYDVINEQMFNDIQRLNGNAPDLPLAYQPNYQEETSRRLAIEARDEIMRKAQNLARQRKKLAKKALSPNVYNYIDKNLMDTPELRRLVNPYSIVANQEYQMGGMQEMPQEEQMEQSRQEQQIMQMVAQALQQGTPPEQIMQMLVQQGIPQEQAQMIIQEVMAQMQGGQQQPQGQPMPQEGMPMQRMGGFRPKGLSFDY